MPRPLKMFMRGKRVRTLQEMLKRLGYPMNDQPAVFGASTRDAVKNFQSEKGLKNTGIVDDALLNLMRQGHNISDMESKNRTKPEPEAAAAAQPVNQNRLDALIRLLVRKGVVSEEELQAEMQRIPPKKATQLPLG
ncbi:MAG: peptidoglycan-binding domain-containing protein [Mariprofundaceae bacterium]|nr:peptidoglycan-binding domain-containing protein [Mariprofundaceae bacterium]